MVPKGNPHHSTTTGEMAIYRANCLIFTKGRCGCSRSQTLNLQWAGGGSLASGYMETKMGIAICRYQDESGWEPQNLSKVYSCFEGLKYFPGEYFLGWGTSCQLS